MQPIRPDYAADTVAGLIPALLGGHQNGWVPPWVVGAEALVLLVLDGFGWRALEEHRSLLPVLSGMEGRPITTVVPSTTASALTSIVTGEPPSRHGIFGYRMRVGGQVLDVLRWKVPEGRPPAVEAVTAVEAFGGRSLPVVTRAEFVRTGFTLAHMRGARFVGWRTTSTLVEHVGRLVAEGERFVYAYYDGVDKVAHEYGLAAPFFPGELAATDRLVGEVLGVLPEHAVLVVTADHGQVSFDEWVTLEPLAPMVAAYAGDARFRYLHARRGAEADLAKAAADLLADRAWVFTREELIDDRWLGPGPPAGDFVSRIGDVTLAARDTVAFADPTHPLETRLAAGHGSLTPEEMLVPLLTARGRKG